MKPSKFKFFGSIVSAAMFDGTIESAKELCAWFNDDKEEPIISYITHDGDHKKAHNVLVETNEDSYCEQLNEGDHLVVFASGNFTIIERKLFEKHASPVIQDNGRVFKPSKIEREEE